MGDALPKYIINFDEFISLLSHDLLELVSGALKNKYPQISTNNLEAILEDLKKLLPNEKYNGLKKNIDIIINNSSINGIQKVEGRILDVPPIITDIKEVFKYDKDIFLTGLHFNQTGWKKNDRYDLVVDKNIIIKDATIKEIGEHKYFNNYLTINANTPIDFILKNKSGNSRQTLIDLEYIEKLEPPIPPPPDPGINLDDIPNDWDVAVVMNWEEGSLADLDMYGFLKDRYVSYNHKDDGDFHLNFDFRSHLNNTNPEIISVKGYKGDNLSIYIHNYSALILNEPVSVKVYAKDILGISLKKEYDIIMPADNTYKIGVCSINLSSLIITDLNNKI